MQTRTLLTLAGVALALTSATLALTFVAPTLVEATDHNEPQSLNAISPDVLSDAADIYGNFVFTSNDSLILITTFPAPPLGFGYLPGPSPERIYDETHPRAYDADVLYVTHIDRDFGLIADRNLVDSEITITARFGYDEANARWGVQVDGLPEDDAIEGPVNQELVGESGVRIRAGLFDEPFFFDLERFFEAQQTDVINFRRDVDFFVGWNVHAIVIEIPIEDVATTFRRQLGVWVNTQRLPGDPFIRPGNACE